MITRAPVRIDFAGGWTDVPPYSTRHGGAVVNAAVALHVLVDVRKRAAGIRLSSADLGQSLQVESTRELVYDGRLDLIKAAVRRSGLGEGWEVSTRSTVPAGSGLGASGALGVALVTAAHAAAGAPLKPESAAEMAHLLETEELKVAGGKQDQYAAALGGFTLLEFRDPEVTATRLKLEPGFLRELESRLVLCHTGTSRISGDMIARVMRGFESGDRKIVEALDGMHDAAIAASDALSAADIDALAEVVEANWRNQQALDAGQTTAAMERIEAAAKAAGVIGSKACGAGAGGSMLFLVGPEAAEGVKTAVQAAGGTLLPVSFDFEGVRSAPAIAV
jgi:D-glycero-alpha-D-manno-heptose-7-phosphate kinase